jgi:hypothetical protein
MACAAKYKALELIELIVGGDGPGTRHQHQPQSERSMRQSWVHADEGHSSDYVAAHAMGSRHIRSETGGSFASGAGAA